MKKFLLLSGFIGAIGLLGLNASPLTPEQAISRINQEGSSKIAPSSSLQLKKTFNDKLNIPASYLFSDNEGFILVSADDQAVPVLGYGNNSINENMDYPPEFIYWVEQLNKQIEYLRENGISAVSLENSFKANPIEPLTKTKWDQTSPYDLQCPFYQGSNLPTGCVATAMAQVMKYHEYPQRGKGSISYNPSSISSGSVIRYNLSMDFEAQDFDWANMLDQYIGNSYNEEQAQAVAYLMKACGYSSKMVYGPGASSALTTNQALALVNYFNYDVSLDFLIRNQYQYNEWAQIIYDNLAQGQPVIYGGVGATGGGHSFICDGFDGNGYFHFNWGWSGEADGYFLLDVLQPSVQGTGGNLSGFDFEQDAIVNIKPAEDNSIEAPQFISQYGSLIAEVDENNVLLLGVQNPIYWGLGWGNLGYRPVDFSFYISVEPINGSLGETQYLESYNYKNLSLNPYSYYPYVSNNKAYPVVFDLDELILKDGYYNVILGSNNNKSNTLEFLPVKPYVGNFNNILLKVENEEISVIDYLPEEFLIENVSVNVSEFVYGEPVTVKATITNKTDLQLSSGVGPVALSADGIYLFSGESSMLTLNPGESKEMTWNVTFASSGNTLPSESIPVNIGVYNVKTESIYPGDYAEATLLPIQDMPVISAVIELPDVTFNDGLYTITNYNDIKVNLTLSLEKGLFSYPVALEINEDENLSNYFYPVFYDTFPSSISLKVGETKTFEKSLNFANAELDKTYTLTAAYLNNGTVYRFNPVLRFAIGEAGIESVYSSDNIVFGIKEPREIIISSAADLDKVHIFKADGSVVRYLDNVGTDEITLDLTGVSGLIIVKATDKDGHTGSFKTIL